MSRTHLQRVFTTIGGLALAGTLALAQAAPVLFDVPLSDPMKPPLAWFQMSATSFIEPARCTRPAPTRRSPGTSPSADCRARPRWRISMGPPLWERTRG